MGAFRPDRISLSLFPVAAVGLLLFSQVVRAANPSSGTLTDTATTLTYTAGPFYVPNVTDNVNGTPTCSTTVPAEQCDTYTLTVNVASGDQSTKQISVAVSFPISAGEFDVFVYNSSNAVIASNASGADPSSVIIPAVSGTYTIVVEPWNPLPRRLPESRPGIKLTPRPPRPVVLAPRASLPSASTGIPTSHRSSTAP
jgi:hypothetical protein